MTPEQIKLPDARKEEPAGKRKAQSLKRRSVRKQERSILDPFAAKLLEMEAAKMTLAEMSEWLNREGRIKEKVALTTIGTFLRKDRARRELEKQHAIVLKGITRGVRTCRDLEKQFEADPPPSLELLMKLQRKLVMTISTAATENPELVKLVTAAFEPVMTNESLRIKRSELALNGRKVAVLEKKAEASDEGEASEPTLSPEEQRRRLKEILK